MNTWQTTEYKTQPDTCPHCRVRFLDDKFYQAELRHHALRYGQISATVKLNEDYMEWHDEGHERECPACDGAGGFQGPADNTDFDVCFACDGEGIVRGTPQGS